MIYTSLRSPCYTYVIIACFHISTVTSAVSQILSTNKNITYMLYFHRHSQLLARRWVISYFCCCCCRLHLRTTFFQGKNVRENKQSIVPNQKRVHTHRLHTHILAALCFHSLQKVYVDRENSLRLMVVVETWKHFDARVTQMLAQKKIPPFQEMHRTQSCHYCQE